MVHTNECLNDTIPYEYKVESTAPRACEAFAQLHLSQPCTPEARRLIFSKDYLSIEDVQILLGMSYGDAAKLIRQIKRRFDRLNIRGKLHVQDYLDYYKLPADRYLILRDEYDDTLLGEK